MLSPFLLRSKQGYEPRWSFEQKILKLYFFNTFSILSVILLNFKVFKQEIQIYLKQASPTVHRTRLQIFCFHLNLIRRHMMKQNKNEKSQTTFQIILY